MSDIQNLPAVVVAPGVVPDDGHDHWLSPRNLIAFAIVIATIVDVFAPYFFPVPLGRNGDLIISGSKMLETVVMLVLAFFFGTTVGSQRQQETIRQQALAAPTALPPPDPSLNIKVDPPATVEVKETPDAHADAVDRAGPTADSPGFQGFSSGPRE